VSWNLGGREVGRKVFAVNRGLAFLEKTSPGVCRAEVLMSFMNVVKSIDAI
jgi:hypothetical protein